MPQTGQAALLQACRLHPILKALCANPDISPSYLQRRAKEVDPGFVVGPVPTHPAFSEANMAERVAWCKKWIDLPPIFWWGVVFVDEFTVFEKPLPQSAIHRRGDHLTMTDSRLHHFDWGTYGKLSLCYAVNAHVGLVGYWWIHNSDGYQGRKIYVVSAGKGG